MYFSLLEITTWKKKLESTSTSDGARKAKLEHVMSPHELLIPIAQLHEEILLYENTAFKGQMSAL